MENKATKASFSVNDSSDIVTWETEDVRVIFSDPGIQAWDSVVLVKDISEILYYYYGVEVYRKIVKEKKGKTKEKWKQVFCVRAHDFPALLNVPEMAKAIAETDFDSDSWQKEVRTGSDGKPRTWLKKLYSTTDVFAEDCYEMTRTVCVMGEEERIDFCTLFLGTGQEKDGSDIFTSYTRGLNISSLSVEELLTFGDAASAFIKLSIDKYNERIQKCLEKAKEAFYVKDGKLYEQYNDAIENIYLPGDEIAIQTLSTDEQGNSVFVDYQGMLQSIQEDAIVLSNAIWRFRHTVKKMEEPVTIKINTLTDTCLDLSDSKKLKYNEQECFLDFLPILSEDEKREFAVYDTEKLISKWKNAVVNRTWMCRKEHGFDDGMDMAEKIIKKLADTFKTAYSKTE